ncbi:hypothetical protein AJ79_09257 [Helicocarpus griseus UAMH5409]|uniref:ABM domain-containing protein n=1 Tax=Helicocarpus griseus UAMH5409 TaxID=1447875 RepID=A0A2B7WKP3_9EURO|nr:hypothetical protein AJ79_09257 [Helicocarpus griseus UAMH5409]
MASKEINLVATLKPKAGKIDEVAALFAETAKKVHATEPDTLTYYAIQPKEGDVLLVVERYKNGQALQAHGNSDHFKAFAAAVQPLLQEPFGATIGRQVGGFRREKL